MGDAHTFTVTVSKSVAGDLTPADDGTIVDVTLTHSNPAGVVDLVSNTCASPGTVNGQCTVTLSSDEPGTVTATPKPALRSATRPSTSKPNQGPARTRPR